MAYNNYNNMKNCQLSEIGLKVGIEIHFLLLQLFRVDSNCWGSVISLATVAEMCKVL